MWKDCLYAHGVKKLLERLWLKGVVLSILKMILGEDVYKNRICILSTFQGIISDVLKISVDDQMFSVRIKEAP